MRNYPASLCLLILAVWISVIESTLAQQFPLGLPEIRNFTSKDYQWHPKNFSVTQGKNGLIYIGNSYGILEYDGKMWRKILLPKGLDGHTMTRASEGQILVGSFNEYGTLTHQIDGTTTYQSRSATGQDVGEIEHVFTDNDRLFLATSQTVWMHSSNQLSVVVNSSSGLSFTRLIKDYLYFQEDGTLFRKNLTNNAIDQKFTLNKTVSGLIATPEDTLVVFENGGFYNIDERNSFRPKNLPFDLKVSRAILLQSGQIAIASANRGLFVLDQSLQLMHHIDSRYGLLSDKIFDLTEDFEGNIWLALDNGISHITLQTPFTYYGQTIGIRGMGYASALIRDQLYLGTSQGAFTHNNAGEFAMVKGSEGQVYELKEYKSKLLMAHESGLFQLSQNEFQPITEQHAWCIRQVPDIDDQLIIGTDQGVLLVNYAGDKIRRSVPFDGFTESSRVMEFDTDRRLWVCHGNKGLYRLTLDFQNHKVTNIEFYSQEEGNLPVYVSFISQSRNGLMFSAENGVYSFDSTSRTFEPDEKVNQFLEHNYYVDKIIEGTYGNLWIIQDNKISKLDLLDNGNYTLLPENIITELNGNLVGSYEHLYVYDSNNVVIGTQEGFAQFNVQANINYRMARQQTELKTFIREVRFENSDSSFLADNQMASAVKLSHDYNNITFTYAPGYYQSRVPIKFSFYLEDKRLEREPNWSDWHESNQNSFKNLSPGSYVFHVRSRGDQLKASQPTSYPFIIQSPWYSTRLSMVIYTLCLVLIGITIYKVRVGKLKKEKKEAINQKDEELRQQKLIAEGEKIKLINERLKEKVTLKNKELGSVALEITRKNEFLGQLKKSLTQLSTSLSNDGAYKLKRTIRSIDQNMRSDNNWERFELYFDESHQDFIRKLKEKQPDLTKSSINLCAFLKLDLSSKEIASLMNISVSGVEKRRYRLRKKLDLDSDTNLKAYLENI